MTTEPAEAPHPSLFVSHSSLDKPLVDDFVNYILRLGCDWPFRHIFYSSHPALRTWPGKAWIHDLKLKMLGAKLIVLILSQNFYNSDYCLAEMGASWVLDDNVELFPVLVPPLDRSTPGGVLYDRQIGLINDSSYLDELRDMTARCTRRHVEHVADWTTQRDAFLKRLQSHLARPAPASPLTSRYVIRKPRRPLLPDVRPQRPLVLPAPTEPHTETARQTNHAVLEERAAAVRDCLRRLPVIVRQALQMHCCHRVLQLESTAEQAQAKLAFWDGHLQEDSHGSFAINPSDALVKDALSAIEKVDAFIRSVGTHYHHEFSSTHGYPADVCSEHFWNAYLVPGYEG